MIKVRFSKSEEESGLRPLSEKEIQKKLYGAYLDPVKDAAEAAGSGERGTLEAFPRKEPRVGLKGPMATPPRSLPWRRAVSIVSEIVEAVAGTVRRFLPRLSTKWSVGAGVVIVLFLGIHALNMYRTDAMKNAKPVAVIPTPSKTSKPAEKTVNVPPSQTVASVLSPATQAPSTPLKRPRPLTRRPSPAPAPPPVAPTALAKPYVIQVATYANPQDAERLSDRLNQSGLPAFVRSSSRTNGKAFYLVFLGRFQTFEEAQAELKAFRNHPMAKDFPDSFARAL